MMYATAKNLPEQPSTFVINIRASHSKSDINMTDEELMIN